MQFNAPFHFEIRLNVCPWGVTKFDRISFVDFFNSYMDFNATCFWKNLDVDTTRSFLAGEKVETLVIVRDISLPKLFQERPLPFCVDSKVDEFVPAEVNVLEAYEAKDLPASLKEKFQSDLDNARVPLNDESSYVKISICLKKSLRLSHRRDKFASFSKGENSLACLRDILEHMSNFYMRKVKPHRYIIVRRPAQGSDARELFIKNYRCAMDAGKLLEGIVECYPDSEKIAPLRRELAQYGKHNIFTCRKIRTLSIPPARKEVWGGRKFKWISCFHYKSRWHAKMESSFEFGATFFFDMYSHIYAMKRYVENIKNCSDASRWNQFGNRWFKASMELYENGKLADPETRQELLREEFFLQQEAAFLKIFLEEMQEEVRRLTQFIDIQTSILREKIKNFSLTGMRLKEVQRCLAEMLAEGIPLHPMDFLEDENPVVREYAKSLVMGIEFLP